MTGLLDAVERADGVAAVSGHVMEAIVARRARWVLAPHPDDATRPPIGVAVTIATDPAEVAVHPAYRRRGLGTELVHSAVEREGAVWAYGDLPAARAVARRLALTGSRILLRMHRSLPVPPGDRALPDGVRVRTFRPGVDDDAVVAVNARAFATHPEQGRMTLEDLHEQMAQPWFDPAGLLVAVVDRDPSAGQHQVVGFHWTKVHHDGDQPLGEVYVLAVDPAAEVRGLGQPLTEAGLDVLARRGLREVMLYTEADNDRARRLYDRLGFSVERSSVVYVPGAAG